VKKKVSFKKMLDFVSPKPEKSAQVAPLKKTPTPKPKTAEVRETPQKKAKNDKPSERHNVRIKKIVLFNLANEYYGIDVSKIDEIIDTEIKEKIAGLPHFVIGVISLRGESVPVLSVKNRFHLPERPIKESETILITSKNHETYGILIDELKGVINIESKLILDVPVIFPENEMAYMQGIIKYGMDIATLIDIERVLKDCQIV